MTTCCKALKNITFKPLLEGFLTSFTLKFLKSDSEDGVKTTQNNNKKKHTKIHQTHRQTKQQIYNLCAKECYLPSKQQLKESFWLQGKCYIRHFWPTIFIFADTVAYCYKLLNTWFLKQQQQEKHLYECLIELFYIL